MFLYFPSLPCIPGLVSSLIVSNDDFPSQTGDVGQGGAGLQAGQGKWLGAEGAGSPQQTGPWGAVPGGEGSRVGVNRDELGLPRGEERSGDCPRLGGVGETAVPSPEASACLLLLQIITIFLKSKYRKCVCVCVQVQVGIRVVVPGREEQGSRWKGWAEAEQHRRARERSTKRWSTMAEMEEEASKKGGKKCWPKNQSRTQHRRGQVLC